MSTSRTQRAVLCAALSVALLKGGLTAIVTPAFQTPDEYGHYDYVLYLSQIHWGAFLHGDVAKPTGYNDVTTEELWETTRATGTESHLRGSGLARPLPSFAEAVAAASGFEPSDTHERLRTKVVVAPQFNYPVLYYGACSVVVKAVRLITANPVIAYHVVRATSLGLTLLTVFFVWRAAQLLFSDGSWLPTACATAFTALQPQLSMLGTSVQSDVLAIALVTLAGTVGTAYALTPTRRGSLQLGVLVGLLLLTKVHAAAAVAVAVAAVISWRRRSEGAWAVLGELAPAAALATVLGLWWYVRSYVLYGSATGMVGDFKTAQFAGKRQNIRAWLLQWRLTVDSFWGMWGWLEVALPAWHYRVLDWLSVLSGAAAAVELTKRGTTSRQSSALVFWAALTFAYATMMLVVAALIGPVHNNQGRHWMPLIAVPALLLSSACAWLEARSSTAAKFFLGVWCAILVAANVRLILSTSAFYGGYGF